MSAALENTVAKRASGGRPGRFRAALVAVVAAAAGAAVVYRILRSGSGSEQTAQQLDDA